MHYIPIQEVKIHLQDASITNCTQIPFNESEINDLNNLPHRSNRGIIYHVLNFFIFGCKKDVGYYIKGSFSVEDILVGNVCGDSKNRKIKLTGIRSSTDDQNYDDKINSQDTDEILKNIGQNETHDGNSLDDNPDQNDFQDGIQALLMDYPFLGDVNFWFKIAIVSISIVLILIIGIIAYCLKR